MSGFRYAEWSKTVVQAVRAADKRVQFPPSAIDKTRKKYILSAESADFLQKCGLSHIKK